MNTTLTQELTHEEMLRMDREELREELFEKRAEWLSDHSATNADVLTNDDGTEYILMLDEENSIEYLPDELTISGIELAF